MNKILLISVIGLLLAGCASSQKNNIINKDEIERKNAEIVKTAQSNIALGMSKLQNKEHIQCDFNDPSGLQNRFFLEDFTFVLKEKLIVKKSPIFTKGKIYCTIKYTSNYPATEYPIDVIERGIINYAHYDIYYSDLSGSIGGDSRSITSSNYWDFGCNRDKMTDNKECNITNYDANVTIYKNKNGYMLQIGYDHFPDKSVSIRINKNKPYYSASNDGTFDYVRSQAIVKSIKNKDTVFVRFVKWPYDNEITNELNVTSFEQAIKILDTIYNKY